MRGLLVFVLAMRLELGDAGSEDAYEEACQDIIGIATRAAKAFNSQDHDTAEKLMGDVEAQYLVAVELAPTPLATQAHANYAQAMHNGRRMTQAIAGWEAALDGVPENDQMYPMLTARLAKSRYGQYSIARDEAYAEGRGNISQALEHAYEQLSVYRSPKILFGIATLHVMLVETGGDEMVQPALDNFLASQEVAVQAWATGQQKEGRCLKGAVLVPDWLQAAQSSAVQIALVREDRDTKASTYGFNGVHVYGADGEVSKVPMRYRERKLYIATIKNVEICGPDAVITVPRKKGKCLVGPGSVGRYGNLELQFQMATTWEGQLMWHDAHLGRYPNHGEGLVKTERYGTIAMIGQFAAKSFYHFVMEVLPRLLLLRPMLVENKDIKILCPGDSSKNKFITKLLAMIPGLDGENLVHRFVPYENGGPPDVRAKAKKLIVPGWEPIKSMDHAGHCLAPGSLLRELREVLAPQTPVASRTTVIYTTRKGQTMRNMDADEERLVARLKAAVVAPYELVLFDGSLGPAEALALFRSAIVVVGVHGGALTNIIACGEGSKLIEIGFRSPMTRHYSHAAAALKMKYDQVLLAPDSRGVGAPQVTLDGMTTPDMVAARVAGFLTSLTGADAAAAGQTADAKEEL